MAVERINPRIWLAQYHLSSDHNRVEWTIGVKEQNGTVFTDTALNPKGTIPMVEASGGGFLTMGSANVHGVLKSNLNVANVPVTVGLDGGTDGTKAEFSLMREVVY